MLVINKNNLFTEVSFEESATVSGGQVTNLFNLDQYLYILGAGITFGNAGLTTDEIQFAFERSFDFNNDNNTDA
ncbi:hypothetical protein [Anabaena sp. UHCC 0399]|uniref:hypothetical protein n=1 Tax=Anabaena sp. UHCC 0399 TaxID=3110238 RepID=UPI002B1EB03B|nr:hypothetical protein [Anabaena sp. UHCC 0399]MEA5568057.1 hypothetical protein [Anabaena sp. UHCC 0399]